MIFPDRVFGRSGVMNTRLGASNRTDLARYVRPKFGFIRFGPHRAG